MSTTNQSEKAYQQIKKEIQGRYIEPGNRIKEVFWAEKLKVNRGDIRQALAQLHSDGLVTKGPKRGFFVRQYTDADLCEIYESRFILEKGAAELAISRATKTDLNELESVCRHMETMAENGYEQGFNEADLRFHATIVKAAHNEKLLQIYSKANLLLTGFNARMAKDSIVAELQQIAADHREIVNALKNKKLSVLIKLLEKGIK